MCMQVSVYLRMAAADNYVFLCCSLYLIPWDRISLWAWGSQTLLRWLAGGQPINSKEPPASILAALVLQKCFYMVAEDLKSGPQPRTADTWPMGFWSPGVQSLKRGPVMPLAWFKLWTGEQWEQTYGSSDSYEVTLQSHNQGALPITICMWAMEGTRPSGQRWFFQTTLLQIP